MHLLRSEIIYRMNDWILSLVTAGFFSLNRPDINVVVEEAKCYAYIKLLYHLS